MPDPYAALQLTTGVRVTIHELLQRAIYAGVLEGVPTREINAGIIQSIVDEEQRRAVHPPFLITPSERSLSPNPGPPSPDQRAALPPVVCIAHLHANRPVHDPNMEASALTVIWFQEEYAFPIAPRALQALQALDWHALASDE